MKMWSRRRMQSALQTIILTSLFWIIILLFNNVYFTDWCSRSDSTNNINGLPCDCSNATPNEGFASGGKQALVHKLLSKVRSDASGAVRKAVRAVKPALDTATNNPNWPGEHGKAVKLKTAEDEKHAQELFKTHQFNVYASDQIALNRSLNDVRLAQCRQKVYPAPSTYPKVSIIIVFHNEAWSTLLRSLHSIVNRTPLEALAEIIIVDDFSEDKFDHLRGRLEDELKRFDADAVAIRLFRMPKRSGLIRARLKGAAESHGEVLLFLDAHIECTVGWFEPLISRIMEDPTRVVSPIIDVIDDNTFEYVTASDMTWGGFNWKLNFRWFSAPPRENVRRHDDRTLPLRTPTMAGGLFAMYKDYFYKLGAYDEGMDVWGAENLELSFRIWMCGGTLEIITCSHVGHVFRKVTPYSFPGGTAQVINHNQRRVAEVWMDEYAKFFFAINPQAREIKAGDTAGRKALRERLQCKSFRWYLEHIYPESPVPVNYRTLGMIKNIKRAICLDTMAKKAGEPVGLSTCHALGGNQAWALTSLGELQNDELCMSVQSEREAAKLRRCSRTDEHERWTYEPATQLLRHQSFKLCLTTDADKWHPDQLRIVTCDPLDDNQKWEIEGWSSDDTIATALPEH